MATRSVVLALSILLADIPRQTTFQMLPNERLHKERIYQAGDYVIGGLFPVHYAVADDRKTCAKFSDKGLSWLQAFLYAVNRINQTPDILPNITLGYDVRDDCDQVDRAAEAAYDFISGRKFYTELQTNCQSIRNSSTKQRPNSPSPNQCSGINRVRHPSVVAVIGSGSSVVSETVANILGAENVPQISYAATSRWLSNKHRYPSFFRTIPSDDIQVKVMVELVTHFNWTYLSTLATDSVYGELGVQEFEKEIQKQKVCVAIRQTLPRKNVESAIDNFVKNLKNTEKGKKSNVILGFLPEHDTDLLLKEIGKYKLTGKTFVAAESWSDVSGILRQPPEVVEGILGIFSQLGTVPGFDRYLHINALRTLTDHNLWLRAYFERQWNCSLDENVQSEKCQRVEKMLKQSASKQEIFTKSKTAHVVNAVYSIAHALHSVLCEGGKCRKVTDVHGKLRRAMFNTTFPTNLGRVWFDSNGDIQPAKYIVTNVQNINGKLQFVNVGNWDSNLTIFVDKIVWNGGSVPLCHCSADCLPGYRIMFGTSKCCWTCLQCDEGYFSNGTNMEACISCQNVSGKGWTNNTNNTGCVELPFEYLEHGDMLAIVASALSVVLFIIDVFCLIVFVVYRDTPVVKGSNRELTILLLVFLALCFLLPFLYIGEPGFVICKIQPNAFGFVYTVCISIMFTKTRRILMVFTTKMSSLSAIHSERRRAEQKQVLLLVTITLVEGSITGLSTYLLSPDVSFDYSKPRRVILDCGFDWLIIHLVAMSYTCLIAIVCTFLAFKARKLPEAFNEARSTSFTMFMMVLVWIGSVPAYLGSQGRIRTVWFCFSAMLAALPMLLFLIFPKVRIILFNPEKNRADVVRSQTSNHILTKAVRRTSSVSLANSSSQSTHLRKRSNTAGSTDSGTVMIQQKHGRMKKQVSSTESQLTECRRFSNVSERSTASTKAEEGDIDSDTKKANFILDSPESSASRDTKL